MKHKTNFQEASILANGLEEMIDKPSNSLEQHIMPCMQAIEKYIQPNQDFVIEKSLDFAADDEKAMAYREAIEYNDGALFLWNVYKKDSTVVNSKDLLQALSFGWTSDTYDDARRFRMPSYREDKFSFEPTDYFTLIMNDCADEEQSFDKYIDAFGGMKQFILMSILGYYGSNLASALKVLS